jgi:hypothetical protein
MLSIFFIIFGSIGIFLNWPIIKKGIFELLTTPWDVNSLTYALREYRPGFSRLDGDIAAVISVIILVLAFMRTTKTLLNLKTMMLAVTSAILSAEIFYAFSLGLPLYSYTGLLYSTLFYLCAFIASIFRIGSMKSLNSTFMGKPMSESKVFSQTFSRVLSHASTLLKIKLTAQDNIKPGWEKGEERAFEESEIRIGRDEGWANLVIGDAWDSVSGKHGILRIIGKSIVYEPLSSHYSFAVDGTPYTETKELPDNSILTLVSGYGPGLKIAGSSDVHSFLHPQTMKRAGEIAVDEFKKLQSTFKILIIMVLLGLPLLWVFLGLQEKSLGNYITGIENRNNRLNHELQKKSQAIARLDKDKKDAHIQMRRFKQRIEGLKKEGKSKERELRKKIDEFERFKNRVMEESVSKELEHIAKIIDIKFCSQRVAVYFPVVTFFPGGDIVLGTGFFAKKGNGEVSLVNEKNLVFDDKEKKWGESYFFIYPHTWDSFSRYDKMIKEKKISDEAFHRELKKFSRLHDLMIVSGSQWTEMNSRIEPNGIVKTDITDFPGYLYGDVPEIDYRVSILDKVIFYGFREGHRFYTPGIVSDSSESTIEAGISTSAGSAGGLLVKVKVREAGDYSVIGISHPVIKERPENKKKILFLRF